MQKLDTLIVALGHRNDDTGQLSQIALSRCAQAFQSWLANPQAKIICTGGFGDIFNRTQLSHAEWLRRQLICLGVPETSFLAPALSRFTLEDVTLTQTVLGDTSVDNIVLVTSDFHMCRASYIFSQVFANSVILPAAASCELATEQLDQLVQHEKAAFTRDKACFIPVRIGK